MVVVAHLDLTRSTAADHGRSRIVGGKLLRVSEGEGIAASPAAGRTAQVNWDLVDVVKTREAGSRKQGLEGETIYQSIDEY